MTPRVFNIPASAPFLPTLIKALHDGKLGFDFADDPLALSSATLYLPTRRACRLMRDAFLDVLDGDAAILPRIIAIGDIDEDEIAFAEAAAGDIAQTSWLRRLATRRPNTGSRLRARRRSGAADRRHDDARPAVGKARRSGA